MWAGSHWCWSAQMGICKITWTTQHLLLLHNRCARLIHIIIWFWSCHSDGSRWDISQLFFCFGNDNVFNNWIISLWTDSLQKPIIGTSGDDNLFNIVCEIPLSVRADFNCSLYTEDDVLLHQRVSQRSQSGESSFCLFYLSHSELFTRSVNSRQLICVYSLKTQPEIRSPHSDTYTIRGELSLLWFLLKTWTHLMIRDASIIL